MTADNQEQIDYWNGDAGLTWVEQQDVLDALLEPISETLLERAAVVAGERAVDVGCGCGTTTLALAARGAAVWGVDISEPMLAHARARAPAHAEVAFARTDAATQTFTPDHDLVFSRFGVMFFADPAAAFRNLRSALGGSGRLCFACWQTPRQNPWMSLAGAAVQPFLPEPEAQPDPRAPGPFAFADPDYVRAILEAGGFTAIEMEACTPELHLGDSLEQAMALLQQVGPLARALAELQGPARDDAMAAARAALEPHVGAGGLNLASAAWIVRARAG